MEREVIIGNISRLLTRLRTTNSAETPAAKPKVIRSVDEIQREDYNDRWRIPVMHGGEPKHFKFKR